MVRLVSTISALVLLFAPLAAAAQQQFTLDQFVQQLFPQGVQGVSGVQATSTIGFQLQQNLANFLPIAQQYLDVLNPQAGDTEAIIARLELMLKDPKFVAAVQAVASTTQQTNPNQPLINTLLTQALDIQKQIDTLLAAQAVNPAPAAPAAQAPAPAPVGECPAIIRNLIFGVTGNDVVDLQEFLIEKGLLEAGNATGFFGKLTEAAVQAWQKAMNIVTQGDPVANGFGAVGPLTRAALLNCK